MGVEGRRLIDEVFSGAGVIESIKAQFIGESSGQQSAALAEVDQAATAFSTAGAMEPPYDPRTLALIYENSATLRPNIDSYITNIDSYGHTFKPLIDLDSPDSDEKIRHALRSESKRAVSKATTPEDVGKAASAAAAEPSDGEVEARKKLLRVEMQSEAERLGIFFENCAVGLPFSGPEGLRGLTRQDLEVSGNAYWEVLRDGTKTIVGFNRLPTVSMRLKPIDATVVQTFARRRTSLLGFENAPINQRFRRFIQRFEGSSDMVHFRELGDPRCISAQSGKAYADVAAMKASEDDKESTPATEVIHFKLTSPRTVYGIPRWVGVLLAVLGSRQAEEVNFLYFENRSVPPLAILVSGGRLNGDSTKRLEDWIENNIRGKRNFHKILILEAESASPTGAGDPDSGRMKIQLQPLTDAQQKDGLFLEYDERNADKVGQSFRLPRLLRGDVRDFNRSTAEASVDFAEIQVFGPIRQQFDWLMNQIVLSALDIRYHEFSSNAPKVRDPINLSLMIKDLVTANVLTPGEGRELAQGVFNREFLKIDAPWTQMPVGMTIANMNAQDDLHTPGIDEGTRYHQQGMGAGPLSVPGAGPTQQALGVSNNKSLTRAINKLHTRMIEEERAEYATAERETIKVPVDIFHTFFAPANAA